ncbi:hypothetical protein A0U94_05290 [Gluconobacter albidus]|uniref:hypothetical protein n=1 Tax=Gluconobacter albidus TaxID=318683 RepID=UPI00098B10F9|nr:hypothetical protein [Gluconobacter albidus]AQS90470.1 hypothetical protein A0U94_05290 [Gluconobacter albidus]
MAREIGKKLDSESTLLPGDKVTVIDEPKTFLSHSGEDGKCISSCNSSPNTPVLIEFDDEEVFEGNREDLILTEFYTGAVPE